MVELYLHFPIRLHDVALNYLSTGQLYVFTLSDLKAVQGRKIICYETNKRLKLRYVISMLMKVEFTLRLRLIPHSVCEIKMP
jgi:hypothetical protein